MRPDRLTTLAQQALSDAQSDAAARSNPEISGLHLLGALLREKGGKVSINPDAHSVAGLEDVDYGVGIARKAWLEPDQVINTLPVDKVLKSLKRAAQV